MNPRAIGSCTVFLGALAASLSTHQVARAELPSLPARSSVDAVPRNSLWAGTRFGVFLPYGALYTDRSFVSTHFQDVATAGPALELDVGARLERHFIGYGFVEQAFLGRGNNVAWTAPHGGQSAPSTQAVGVGLRWESNPDGLGIIADAAVAYRWFAARWGDETTVRMSGPGDVRVGLGASWRVTPGLTLATMMTVTSGAFSNRALDRQELGESANSYSAIAIGLSGHVDIY
jgi:hypothetical protein